MRSQDELKHLVGLQVARRVTQGQVIGIGSGTTVMAAIRCVAERVRKEGLFVRAVVSSLEAEEACLAAGIVVIPLPTARVAWAFDGADEVDLQLNLLKGRGGALLRERIVDASANRLVIVVDESKVVQQLGTAFPLTVEVLPDARLLVLPLLQELGATQIVLRMSRGKDGPVITEFGHILYDCHFSEIASGLASRIKNLPGVVDCGLFEGMAHEVLVARQDGVWSGLKESRDVSWRLIEPLAQDVQAAM